jgi:hypothetical protein
MSLWPRKQEALKPNEQLPAERSQPGQLKFLSVIIPARDEADCIATMIEHLGSELHSKALAHDVWLEKYFGRGDYRKAGTDR